MDANTRGKLMHLIANDRATGLHAWLGVSGPRGLSVTGMYRAQTKAWLLTMVTYLTQWALFLLPGFAAASALSAKRKPISRVSLVVVVIATGATLGYLSFGAFFLSTSIGRFFSFTVYLSAAGFLAVPLAGMREATKTTLNLVAEPFLYALLAGTCYVSFYFLFMDPCAPNIEWAGDRFFLEGRPTDNGIPLIFADRIYYRQRVAFLFVVSTG